MSWLVDQMGNLLLLFCFLVFITAVLAPFEALGWWAGYGSRPLVPDEPFLEPVESSAPEAHYYLVYLTGVAGFSGSFLARREHGFLDRLRQRLPGAAVISDVFPFSVNNNPLDGDRLLRGLWSWLHARRLKLPNNVFDVLIVVRNIFQFLVSADPRYGPVYNLGVAREIARSLVSRGYRPGSGKPVYLVAYSGGGQIAVGAAPYLHENLRAPVRIVALGGVFSDDPGVQAVDSLVRLRGTRDVWIPGLGALFYPGRWRLLFYSAWNRVVRQGKVRDLVIGPMRHVGRADYFSRSTLDEQGAPYAELSAVHVAQIVTESQTSRKGALLDSQHAGGTGR